MFERLVHIVSIFQCLVVEHTVVLTEVMLKGKRKTPVSRGTGECQVPAKDGKRDKVLQQMFF